MAQPIHERSSIHAKGNSCNEVAIHSYDERHTLTLRQQTEEAHFKASTFGGGVRGIFKVHPNFNSA